MMDEAVMLLCAEEYDLHNISSQYKHISNLNINSQSSEFDPYKNTFGRDEVIEIMDGLFGKGTYRGIIWKRIEAVAMLALKASR